MVHHPGAHVPAWCSVVLNHEVVALTDSTGACRDR
jgi:hypothetical protein